MKAVTSFWYNNRNNTKLNNMKNFISLIITGLILWTLPFYGFSQVTADKESIDFRELSAAFKNPPKEFRPAPLWVWNDKMSRSSIDFMLEDLKSKGFGGAFVHPRPGLITEYMSDEWFELFRYSVDKGLQLGLNIWIYDENSYPSGFAGGHVPAEMPESYNQGQGLEMTSYETLPDTLSNYFLILLKTENHYQDITKTYKDYVGKQKQFYVFHKTYYRKSPWYGGFSYVDLLVPGVTGKFQEITMDGYEKVAGDQFGKTVPGVFTDEPEIPTSGGIRWTPDLFDVFQQKWAYDLKVNLPSLYEEVGDWKRIRHNYTETLLQMFIDRWAKPWHEYCEENNLNWTGHYWEHGWPNLAQGGDNMAMYAWHQQPAIDMLFNQFNETNPRAQFGNVRAVKELRSVANQLGYQRTLCETYGGGGWDVTFEDLKRLGDWTYVLGVNFMNQHLSHTTLKGARKYDYPPVFTYHSPWWPHYKTLNDYFGRLSVVLSNGEQMNDILIIEPTTTLWNYYSYVKGNETLEKIGQEFQSMITHLEKQQVEYDLGSENIIKDNGSVKNGKFVIAKRNYSVVVIPPLVENVEKSTFDLLVEFVKQGGKVISYSVPERISGKQNNEVKEFFQSNASSIFVFDEFDQNDPENYFANPEIEFTNVEGGNLFHQRRKYDDGQVLFLVNSSLDEKTRGSLKTDGVSFIKMDAFSGKVNELPGKKVEGKLSLDFELPPAGSLLLFVSDKEADVQKISNPDINERVVVTDSPLEISTLRENALKIDFCDLFMEDKVYKDIYFSEAADIVFDNYGFQGNPWNHSVQYKSKIVDRDTFQTGGFTVKYYFETDGDIANNNIKICVERPEIFEVRVNNSTVNPIPDKWFVDKSFPVYDASSLVKKGINVVELIVEPMSIFAEIEPVYVIGDFTVWPKDTGWYINTNAPSLELGSWKEQGYPFYSWEVGYKKTYQIEDINKSTKISIPKWDGTVSEVWVNNKFAGIIAFEPFELDVSEFLKIGSNEIEFRVTGSMKNLLGPHFKNPAPGLAGPGNWKNVGKNIPGSGYQMKDYGLFDNFKLITYETGE
jgi:hypothetical protein